MVKTLAKPMLHYRLLNCRASGLLEQRHAHRVLDRPGLVGAFVNYSHRVMPGVLPQSRLIETQ